MSGFELLPTELLKIISSAMKFPDIENLCKISPRLVQICQDRQFWENLIYDVRANAQNLELKSLKHLRQLYQKLVSGGSSYTWGHDKFRNIIEPFPVLEVTEFPVIQVSVGIYHMGYVTSDGRAYLKSLNESSHFPQEHNGEITGMEDIIQIACGKHFTALLTQNGQIYTFGSNVYGQLGRTEGKTLFPDLVTSLSKIKIVQISCGYYHMGAIDDQGQVYLWGSGKDWELGNAINIDQSLPILNPYINKIKQLVCSLGFTLMLTTEGKVYGCGDDKYKQLGLGPSNTVYKLTEIPNLPIIIQIAAGVHHTAFLSMTGDVYTCGNNSYGQLGLGNIGAELVPRKIPDLPKISQVACGFSHTAMITTDGHLYVCGNNMQSVLGTELVAGILFYPTLVPIIDVRHVACGHDYTAAVTNTLVDINKILD